MIPYFNYFNKHSMCNTIMNSKPQSLSSELNPSRYPLSLELAKIRGHSQS